MSHDTYTVSVEPTTEPIERDELKTRLRITSSEFDEELDDLLLAARKQVWPEARELLSWRARIGFPGRLLASPRT